MTPRQAEALRLFREVGSKAETARRLGMDPGNLAKMLNAAMAAERAEAEQPEGVTAALRDAAAQGADAVWLKSKAASILWRRPKAEAGDDLLDRLRAKMEGLTPAAPVPPPAYADDDLLTVYPIADAHVGMLAWGKETGEDYNTEIAVTRIRDWIGRCVAASPASAEAVILDVGDLTHADDHTNETPRSKHNLDVDSRHFRTLDVTIDALDAAVQTALARHRHVRARILPGNHNGESYKTIMFTLAERYRLNPRVTVEKVPGEFFVHRFGRCLIAAHHGHGAKPERMVLGLADEHAEAWGQTRHRHLFTGHLHHHKSADIGGCTWEQLRALTARDAYATAHAYVARSQLQGITFHRERGEVQRVKVGL